MSHVRWLLLGTIVAWAPTASVGAAADKTPPITVTIEPASPDITVPSEFRGVIPEGEPLPAGPIPPRAPVIDPVLQGDGAPGGPRAPGDVMSDPLVNVGGLSANANPPDTTGDVGPNHFVQMVNATFFQVFDKAGNALTGATSFSSLWPVGDPCRRNDGDPIVVYDHLADRWVLTQFRDGRPAGANDGDNRICWAISQTPDPTNGMWFLYSFQTPNFPDYPKIGVWPDGYYVSTYESPNLGIYVFDRPNMVVGNAANAFQRTTLPSLGAPGVRDTRILPADLDGPAPAAGTANYFVRTVDDQQDPGNPNDRIEVYTAAVDWMVPTFTFTLVDTLTPAAFQIMLCNRSGLPPPMMGQPDLRVRDCIPQPGEVDTIDALSNRPMMQLKYRVLSGTPTMVFNQTIDISGTINALLGFTPTNEVAGVRWYELTLPGANWTINQQGTYAPQPGGATTEAELLHRWMGSAAIDMNGNLAIGYSITNSDAMNSVFAGLDYAGRRFDDAAGTLPQGEKVLLAGANAAGDGDMTVEPQRWGDYAQMGVDPLDDCTFWFTSHVAGLATRIGSFSFDTCQADLEITKTDDPDPVVAGQPLAYEITVKNNGPVIAQNVIVTDVLPSEVTYDSDTDSCVQGPVGTLTCNLGNIAAGSSVTFTVNVTVKIDAVLPPDYEKTITNTASVISLTRDDDQTNNKVDEDTTVKARLNHFQCYEVKRRAFPGIPLTLSDQFGSASTQARRAERLCNPADKNDQDPTAPTDPDHLVGYKTRFRFTKVANQTILNQFGTVSVDVLRPDRLFVPSAKSLVGPPPPLAMNLIPHYQCYKVRQSPGTPRFQPIMGVKVEDQLDTVTVDLLRPATLCAPVNKNNEAPGVETDPDHLLCYRTRRQRFGDQPTFVTNQFNAHVGPQTLDLIRGLEVCVPSLKNPSAPTTTTSTTSTTLPVPTTSTTSTTAPTIPEGETTTTSTTSTTMSTTTTTATTSTTTTLSGSPSPAFLGVVPEWN